MVAEKSSLSARGLLAESSLPEDWQRALAHLDGKPDTYWLTTIHPQGGPHVRPVLVAWVEGRLYFCASEHSRKAKNLARDPRCAVTVEREPLDLVVEAVATQVRDSDALQGVAAAYASTYEWQVTVREGAFHDTAGAPTAGPPPYDVYEVTPTRAFGFGTDESFSPTRWDFWLRLRRTQRVEYRAVGPRPRLRPRLTVGL